MRTLASIGVGLIGYGLAGKVFHGMLASQVSALKITAILTTNPERQKQAGADFPQAKIYERYEEVLNDPSVDLVVLGTPHETHHDLTLLACEAKKHVVVDKIMALSSQEADSMIAAAKKNDVFLTVFHNRRWDSDFLTVQHAIRTGLLGEIYTVESSVVGFAPLPAATQGTSSAATTPVAPLRWRQQAKHGGGPYRDWGAHLMDQAVQLFGMDIESVYADFQYRHPGLDVETAAVCDMRFASGVRYRVEVGSISLIRRPRWYVRGSKGALVIHGLDPQEDWLKKGVVVSGKDRAKMPESAVEFKSLDDRAKLEIFPGQYGVFYQNVADVLLHGAKPLVDPVGVRDVLKVMDAAIRSAGTGAVEKVQ